MNNEKEPSSCNLNIEIVEIYALPPNPSKTKKQLQNIKEKGTVHVQLKFDAFTMDIRNISYVVFNNRKSQVHLPFHKFKNYEKENLKNPLCNLHAWILKTKRFLKG